MSESAGLVSLAQFTLFWGLVFLATTTAIAVFVKEDRAGAHTAHHGARTFFIGWELTKPRKTFPKFFLVLTELNQGGKRGGLME